MTDTAHGCPFREEHAGTLNAADIEAKMLETSRQGAKEALAAVGLGNGDSAARDVHDLRRFMAMRREDQQTLRATVVRVVTTAIVGATGAGIAWLIMTSKVAVGG